MESEDKINLDEDFGMSGMDSSSPLSIGFLVNIIRFNYFYFKIFDLIIFILNLFNKTLNHKRRQAGQQLELFDRLHQRS